MSEHVPGPEEELPFIHVDSAKPPELSDFTEYVHGDARQNFALWTNRHHPEEERNIEHTWTADGHGRNRLGELVVRVSRLVVRDGEYQPVYRLVPRKNFVIDREQGRLYFEAPARVTDTQEIPLDEIRSVAGLPESFGKELILHPSAEVEPHQDSPKAVEATPEEPEEAKAPAEKYHPSFRGQLRFELAGDFLTDEQCIIFAPYFPRTEKTVNEIDLYHLLDVPAEEQPLPLRWQTTEKSIEQAEGVMRVARSHDPRVDTIISSFLNEYECEEQQLPLLIRTDRRLRYCLAEHFLGKLQEQASHMLVKDLPYRTDGSKKPAYEGYDGLLPPQEYTVLLALAKIDGTFRHELENKITRGDHGAVWEGKFRVAANRLLGLEGIPKD